jgi:hypothetical protein
MPRAGDKGRFLRQRVAGNAASPPELLARLAGDEDRGVREGVALNNNTLLEDLVNSGVA